jgi:hypothetical protein
VHLPGGGWRLSHLWCLSCPCLHGSQIGAPRSGAGGGTIESNSWRAWRKTEKDPRRQAGLHGDRGFPFDHQPPPRHRTRQPPAPPQDDDNEYNDELTYHNEEAKEYSDDYAACIFQEW